jgi:hypothetical protein
LHGYPEAPVHAYVSEPHASEELALLEVQALLEMGNIFDDMPDVEPFELQPEDLEPAPAMAS